MRSVRRVLGSALLPGLIVVALFAVTLTTDHPVSGIDVRVLLTPCPRAGPSPACRPGPYRALILVRKPGHHEVIAGHRPNRQGRMRLNFAPGEYLLVPRAGARGEPRARAYLTRVRVHENRYTPVTVVYRLSPPARPSTSPASRSSGAVGRRGRRRSLRACRSCRSP